jgi:signal peptidase
MKTFMKITKVILNCIFTLIIIIGIALIGLFCFGIQPYVVETGSMSPTFDAGSLCFVNKRTNYDDMKVGDIIAFKLDSNTFVTHRIAVISDEGFITKGDANSTQDNVTVKREDFIGKNIFSIPKAGIIVKVMQTLSGKIILGTIVIVLFFAGVLIGEPSKKKKENDNNEDDTCE